MAPQMPLLNIVVVTIQRWDIFRVHSLCVKKPKFKLAFANQYSTYFSLQSFIYIEIWIYKLATLETLGTIE